MPTVIALTVGLVLVIHAAIPAVTAQSGGAITSVKIVGSTSPTTTSSTTFANLSTIAMSIPAGHTAFFIVRFTAESACTGDTVGDGCSLKFFVTNTEMQPASGAEFFFDSVKGFPGPVADDGSECPAIAVARQGLQPKTLVVSAVPCGWQSHAVQRNSGVLGGGTYYIHVKDAIVGSGADLFWLDDWSFSVERVMVS